MNHNALMNRIAELERQVEVLTRALEAIAHEEAEQERGNPEAPNWTERTAREALRECHQQVQEK